MFATVYTELARYSPLLCSSTVLTEEYSEYESQIAVLTEEYSEYESQVAVLTEEYSEYESQVAGTGGQEIVDESLLHTHTSIQQN